MLLNPTEKEAHSLLPTNPFLVICPREILDRSIREHIGEYIYIYFCNIICDIREREGTCPSQWEWISKP